MQNRIIYLTNSPKFTQSKFQDEQAGRQAATGQVQRVLKDQKKAAQGFKPTGGEGSSVQMQIFTCRSPDPRADPVLEDWCVRLGGFPVV